MTSFIQPDIFTGGVAAWPFEDLLPQSYGLIVCDPPWRFENYSAAGDEKGPEPHYATMADDEILALPVGDLAAADAMLWLWCTWPKLEVGLAALQCWGFTYKTGGAWDKRRWGTGYIWRSQCEPVLIGTRGSPTIDGRTVTNLITEPRREHSRKPEAAYVRAERMAGAVRRVSLFERVARPGWDAWGDEVGVAPGRKRAKRLRERPPLLDAMGGVGSISLTPAVRRCAAAGSAGAPQCGGSQSLPVEPTADRPAGPSAQAGAGASAGHPCDGGKL